MNPHIGFYNKKNGESFKYKVSDFIEVTGLNGLFQVKGTHENNFIFTILPSELKQKNTTIPELKSIIGDIKEDDNPILCLLKFKQ